VAACGATYLLTMVDRTTRWVEVAVLKDISAATCSDAFLSTWVARFGVPATVTSDKGAQFTSETWKQLCTRLGVCHVTTTSYHPQSNGMIERVHRQLKDALRARGAGLDWPSHLPLVLLGLRAAPKEVSGFSSAEAVFGQPLTLPGELKNVPEEAALEFQSRLASDDPPPTSQPRTYAEAVSSNLQPGLQEAKFVYIRRGGSGPPLASNYLGPYRVLQPGVKFFRVEVGDKQEVVSVDRLKPHLGVSSPTPASAPVRGRPKKVISPPESAT